MPRKPPERVVVITGASNGAGRAVALEFALHNNALVLGSRREGPLDVVRRDCEALHALTMGHVADLRDESAAFGLANAALARFKRVDVWINYVPPMPLLRGDVTPAEALGDPASFDLTGYVNGATAAFACFKALGGGVLINVDPLSGGAPAGFETEFAEARRRVQETFAEIERLGSAISGVQVTNVVPPRTPIAAETLAPMIVSLATAQSRGGTIGRLLGVVERERFRVWSRMVPPHRRGSRPEVAVQSRGAEGAAAQPSAADDTSRWAAPETRPTKRRRADGHTSGTRVVDRDSSGRHGSWHLTSVASSKQHASTIALILGVPVMVLAVALLLVR